MTVVKIPRLLSPPTAAAAGHVRNSWVLPEQKIVFVSIGKNACTSIKWLLAEISGQDVDRILDADSNQSTRRMLIHRRKSWVGTYRLSDLDAATLDQVGPENGWFVFAVVRDPRLRMFSAWQSKFLVGDPSYSGTKYVGRDWLPRTPESAQDVLDDWARFITAVEEGPGKGGPPLGDGHFAPNTRRLHEDVVPYSRIYDISELGQLTDDLAEHLRPPGGEAPELTLVQENDTPLRACHEVYAGDLLGRIETLYASDLERFGSIWSETFAKTFARPLDWSQDALRDIAARRAINERVADLGVKLERRKSRLVELSREVRTLKAETARLRRQAARPSPEITRRRTGGVSAKSWCAAVFRRGKRTVKRLAGRPT